MYNKFKNLIPISLIVSLSRFDTITRVIQNLYFKFFSYPKFLQIHTTGECNYSCPYCYSNNISPSNINWEDIIDDARLLKVQEISFLGGEPLLDKKLTRYIEQCLRHKINVKIFTNAALLDDGWLSFFARAKTKIQLAVKIDCQECYEKFTSQDTFHLVLDNIRKCSERGIKVIGHVVITKTNHNQIEEIMNIGEDLNIPLEFERYIPISQEIDSLLKINREEWNSALDKIKSTREKQYNQNLARAMIRGCHCACYIELLSINSSGDVLPCPLATKDQKIGNISEGSLKSIWNDFLKQKKEWEKIPVECKACKSKFLCHGGCKTHVFLKYGNYSRKDPLCNGSNLPIS